MGGRGKAARAEILTVLLWLPFALSTLGIALYLGTCALPMGLEYLTGNGTGTGGREDIEKLPITDLDLTEKVPAPVAEKTPATSFVASQYTGKVAWINLDANAAYDGALLSFEAGIQYEAVVEMTPAPGYAFGEVSSGASLRTAETAVRTVFFKHSEGTVEPGEAGQAVNIIFPRTGSFPAAVTDLDLTNKVPAPVKGATAETSFAGSQYTGDVAWDPADTRFQTGMSYTATVTLTAAPGWTFEGAGSFTHRRAEKITKKAEGVVGLVFPEIGSGSAGIVVEW
jgi:hypothetical protein